MGKEKVERIFKHESWKGLPVHEWATVGSMIVVALTPSMVAGRAAFCVGLLCEARDCEAQALRDLAMEECEGRAAEARALKAAVAEAAVAPAVEAQ